jgi:hypothetical protein
MSKSPREMLIEALIGPHIPRYYEELGRFIDVFADVESNLQLALWKIAKLRSPIAQALLSNSRVAEASSQIKRLAHALGWSAKRRDRLTILFSQLGVITQTRNDMLHFGAIHRGDGVHEITNILYVYEPGRIRTTKISVEILQSMVSDLLIIASELSVMRKGRKSSATMRRAAAQMPPKRAWQYKPDIQQGLPRKPRGPLQGLPPPPQSSQG